MKPNTVIALLLWANVVGGVIRMFGYSPFVTTAAALSAVVSLVFVGIYIVGGGYERTAALDSTGSVDAAPAGTTESAESAPERPNTGSLVRLLKSDWFLTEHHAATVGSIGTVVGWSGVSVNDNGILVDWGNGQEVRTDLVEVERFADAWATPCSSVSTVEPWKCILRDGHDGLHRGAHPRVKWANADEAAGL